MPSMMRHRKQAEIEVELAQIERHSKIYLGDRVIDTTKLKKTLPVLRYKVFGTEKSLPSASELEIAPLPLDEKQKVVDYLQNLDFRGTSFLQGPLTDAFTGELMPAKGNGFNDGTWYWYDDLWFYVDKHDVKLPDDFVQHVLDFYESGGKVEKKPLPFTQQELEERAREIQ